MSSKEINEICRDLERAARKSAKLILNKMLKQPQLNSWRKGDDTVVTEADLESQSLLVEELSGILPLVCEEDITSHKLLESESSYILIDPLDGTTSARRFGAGIAGQVGYGPIVGLVYNSRLVAAVFVNIASRQVYSAIRGESLESSSLLEDENQRQQVPQALSVPMDKAALLFYAGKRGELRSLEKLRSSSCLENYYRFGGFANDAVRVALNFEQAQLQFSVKAWDLPAALLPQTVGRKVVLDPLGEMVELNDYRPRLENPLVLGQVDIVDQILKIIRQD